MLYFAVLSKCPVLLLCSAIRSSLALFFDSYQIHSKLRSKPNLPLYHTKSPLNLLSLSFLPLLRFAFWYPPQNFRQFQGREGAIGWTMLGDLITWLLSFFFVIALIIIVLYQLMCLADLEFDYINPYETATRINKIVLPEFITQGTLCFLYLVTGHWVMLLLCIPYLYHNVKTYMDRQHLIDVTEIFNHLNWEKKKRLFKLGYLVLVLFFSLFWLIWSALEDDEHMI